MSGTDFHFEEAIAARAAACNLRPGEEAVAAMAEHARTVLRMNEHLHLTTVTEPTEFLERHIGESLEGASILPAGITGSLLDLGSGNGYPGLPLAAIHPGLRVVLSEASQKKAGFLEMLLSKGGFPGARVLARQVQRPGDLDFDGELGVIATRAMGGWHKVLPRFASRLAGDGELLLWAGAEVDGIRTRKVWQRLHLRDRHTLPGRESSWIWRFGRS